MVINDSLLFNRRQLSIYHALRILPSLPMLTSKQHLAITPRPQLGLPVGTI